MPIQKINITEPISLQFFIYNISKEDIKKILKFSGYKQSGDKKSKYCWDFQDDQGRKGAIWDYKNSYKIKKWSCWGNKQLFIDLGLFKPT